MTPQTRITPSVYPVYSVAPSADHASDVHECCTPFFDVGGKSGRSSTTVDLLSRSQILTHEAVAAQSQ